MSPTFAAAAQVLLAEQGHRLPDLSGVTVLVPHHRLVPAMLAAVRAQLGTPVFLPPRLVTLPALAAAAGTEVGGQRDSQRLAALYGFLSRQDWLDEAAGWPLAQAMLDLLNALDDATLAPPTGFRSFAAQVETAVGRRLGAPLERETRLAFDLWRAFHQAGPGSRGIYAAGLANWLNQVRGPLYSIGLSALSPLEQGFLSACRAQGLVELPVAEPFPTRRALFDAVWRAGAEAAPMRDRALAWAGNAPAGPLALELYGAPDLEAEATVAAARIRTWLGQGRRAIAVVALDRLAARRLRAVLERSRVLLQDETGWTFATAAVSHVLDRWLTLLRDGFYHRDLFDFLKSPFVFADVPMPERLEAVAELERLAARHNVVSRLERFHELAAAAAPAATSLLARLTAAARAYDFARRSLSDWLAILFQSLDQLGATPAIAADTAGRQLLDLLHRLARELAGDRSLYPLGRWHAWLTLQLDRNTFVADDIESPVRLTHLAAARLRDFEAVVVLGADAAHLPGARPDELFSDAVRVQLGLPGQRQRWDETLADLIDVLSRAELALITWQARQGTEPNPRSPWLDKLCAFHALAYGDTLERALSAAPAAPPQPAPDTLAAGRGELPARLSARGWQTLVSCPYRYFARYVLHLAEGDEVAETMEKADYGERVHEILRRFHAGNPELSGRERAQLLAALQDLSRAVFLSREREDYLALAWRMRWEQHLPAYLDWALAHEAAGWRWRQAEAGYERVLPLPDGGSVTLHGRLDRVDDGPAGTAVLDYKTQSRSILRGRLKAPGEDVQLPFYGLLTDAARAGLVALDDDKIDLVEAPVPLPDAVAAERERLVAALTALAEGVSLPAHGAPETCRWCEMRGLCRRA